MALLRIRGRHGDFLLVPARGVRRVSDRRVARTLARRLLESAEREGLSEEQLVEGLLSGALLAVEVEAPPRRLDEPQVQELSSLAGPLDGMPEPARLRSWVGLQVVDQRGRPLPWFSVRVDDPAGVRHDVGLDAGARARVDDLEDDGGCTITLSPTEKVR